MNNKFKLATKRITAVAASAALVSSAVVGAPLANYPNNFVSGGEFDGTVVVGSEAAASDMTAAESLIDDLASEFSGEQEKVRIDYSMSSTEGDSISAVDDRETLNINESLESVRADLDDTTSDMFEDGEVDGNTYNQELFLNNGDFEYRIFDEVDGEDTAKYGIYYGANTQFANYSVDFEDALDLTESEDLQGSEMTIMGNEFTIESISDTELTLIGGSNKVTIGEGESQTVTTNGQEYEVEILAVSAGSNQDKVLLSVNGETMTVDEFDSETIAGVTVAVTELVPSSRDSVKGFAEVVVGGQKVTLTNDGGVEINDEDLDDVYEDYQVDVSFSLSNNDEDFDGFDLAYRTDENVVLGDGVTLRDILFDSFELVFEGVNDVDYSTTTLTTSDSGVTFDATLDNGEDLPSEFQLTTDDEETEDLYLGSRNKRIFFNESDLTINSMIDDERTRAMEFNSTAGTVTFNVTDATSDVRDNMFFSYIDDDESYLYKISGVDRRDSELDFQDLFTEQNTNSVDFDEINTTLEFADEAAFSAVSGSTNQSILNVSNLGAATLRFENNLEMDFSEVEVSGFTFGGDESVLKFMYNNDIDMDDQSHEDDNFNVSISKANDEDDALRLSVGGDFWITAGEETEDNSDYEVYVDHYGTIVTLESDDNDWAEIKVPSEEVHGQVSVVFGDSSSESGSVTVDADAVEEKRAELEEDGYTITGTEEVSSEEVEFNVEAPEMDTDVAGTEDLIVVGGPAVNEKARELLGIEDYTVDQAGVSEGEGVARYFEDENSVLIYGYSAADTAAIVSNVNAGTANFE